MILKNFSETLTALLITEAVVKYGAVVPAEISREVQEFTQLFALAQAEFVAASKSSDFRYARLSSRFTYSAADLAKLAVEVDAVFETNLYGSGVPLTTDMINRVLENGKVYAKSWSRLYGPELHTMHFMRNGKQVMVGIQDWMAMRLDVQSYADMEPSFMPPPPILAATPAQTTDYAALIQQIDDNIALRVLAWLMEDGYIDPGEEQLVKDMKALFGDYTDPQNRRNAKNEEYYRVDVIQHTGRIQVRCEVGSPKANEYYVFGIYLDKQTTKIDMMYGHIDATGLIETLSEADLRAMMEQARPIVERIRGAADPLHGTMAELVQLFGMSAFKRQRVTKENDGESFDIEYPLSASMVGSGVYVVRVRSDEQHADEFHGFRVWINPDTGAVTHFKADGSKVQGLYPPELGELDDLESIRKYLATLAPIVKRIRAGQAPSNDLWRVLHLLEDIYMPFADMQEGDERHGISQTGNTGAKGNPFTVERGRLLGTGGVPGSNRNFTFTVSFQARAKIVTHMFTLWLDDTDKVVQFAEFGSKLKRYLSYETALKYLSAFEPLAKQIYKTMPKQP